ncbi:hypothetical protein LIV57_06820 [Chryseobacterium sp. X308]|uniref:hypothetical protein n=1 Tax=Chryseobacterium sp. X308 TaxID=2884873 RepID=UPI001D142B4D|nr:hypothetical protein [Chryseobacterium sp. X308]MCC3214980.1 hypothetical protein [Chryseobacterium sp. X308]
MEEIQIGKEYKTKGGFKLIINHIDIKHRRPYLGYFYHARGHRTVSYYHNLTNEESELEIVSEWDESELPIYYNKEVPFDEDYREIPTNIDHIKGAIEANKDLWFIDKNGNKYQGSKTWVDILNYRLTGKFPEKNLFNYEKA